MSKGNGFKVSELLMLALVMSVLTVMTIPHLSSFKKENTNAAALAALGEMRTHLSLASKLIQAKEDPMALRAPYPTLEELRAGVFLDSHPTLKGKTIFDPLTGRPKNPWTLSNLPETALSEIHECEFEKGRILEEQDKSQRGWCYRPSTGEIWLNTNQNREPSGRTENHF